MKNKTIWILVIVVILLAICSVIFYLTTKKMPLGERKELADIALSDIVKVSLNYYTEASRDPVEIEDKVEIEEVFDALKAIKVGGVSNIRTTDNELYCYLILKDGSYVKFSFEGENIILGNKQYKVEGISKLRTLVYEYSLVAQQLI